MEISWELLGNVVTSGWGPDVIQGLIPKLLGRINIDKCDEYISEDRGLLDGVSEGQWKMLRSVASKGKIELTTESVLAYLEQRRPDVYSIIDNYPDGRGLAWLEKQVAYGRLKLGLDGPPATG
jgi:hypothetical protein